MLMLVTCEEDTDCVDNVFMTADGINADDTSSVPEMMEVDVTTPPTPRSPEIIPEAAVTEPPTPNPPATDSSPPTLTSPENAPNAAEIAPTNARSPVRDMDPAVTEPPTPTSPENAPEAAETAPPTLAFPETARVAAVRDVSALTELAVRGPMTMADVPSMDVPVTTRFVRVGATPTATKPVSEETKRPG